MGPALTVSVGGVSVSPEAVEQALEILRADRSAAVRQPLARRGSPLAFCDYHEVSKPYQVRIAAGEWGRGAAGCPVVKTAFMVALEAALEECELRADAIRRSWLRSVVDDAFSAFSEDHAYMAAMAATATQLLRRPARARAIAAA